jgi:hypothetical protein
MTGIRPPGVPDQHYGSYQQHMQQVGYNPGYPGGPLDIYSASTAGNFEGWTVAQAAAAAHQYGVSGSPLLGHQHIVQAHHMGGHMSHHMMGQVGAHNNSNANRSTMVMHSWGHQHMYMPMISHPYGSSGSPPGGYMAQGGSSSSRGSWPLNQQHKAGGYGGSYSNGRQPGGRGGMQGGRGSRPRRHIVLNTNPGGQWPRVSANLSAVCLVAVLSADTGWLTKYNGSCAVRHCIQSAAT